MILSRHTQCRLLSMCCNQQNLKWTLLLLLLLLLQWFGQPKANADKCASGSIAAVKHDFKLPLLFKD